MILRRLARRLAFASAIFLIVPSAGTSLHVFPTAEAKESQHQRVIPLEGVQNFRDLGGYRTVSGRTVKWGRIYRSGSLHKITPTDIETLRRLGIRTECDFRSTDERQRDPITWPESLKPAVFSEDYDMDAGSLASVLRDPNATAEQARKVFAELYAELPYRFAGQYRRMFDELLAGHVPLVFNCTAGKDRTGVAAALLLSALGVPRAAVMEDFLLSNQFFDPQKMLAADPRPDSPLRKMKPDVLQVIMGVDPSYLDAAFDAINRRSGGIEGYLQKELGLSAVQLALLRSLYLE